MVTDQVTIHVQGRQSAPTFAKAPGRYSASLIIGRNSVLLQLNHLQKPHKLHKQNTFLQVSVVSVQKKITRLSL